MNQLPTHVWYRHIDRDRVSLKSKKHITWMRQQAPDTQSTTHDVCRRVVVERGAILANGTETTHLHVTEQETKISDQVHLAITMNMGTEVWTYVLDSPTSRGLLSTGIE